MQTLGKHITTIQIPTALAEEIKESKISYTGALIRGWEAIKTVKNQNVEIAQLTANMDRYRNAYIELQNDILRGLK